MPNRIDKIYFDAFPLKTATDAKVAKKNEKEDLAISYIDFVQW